MRMSVVHFCRIMLFAALFGLAGQGVESRAEAGRDYAVPFDPDALCGEVPGHATCQFAASGGAPGDPPAAARSSLFALWSATVASHFVAPRTPPPRHAS